MRADAVDLAERYRSLTGRLPHSVLGGCCGTDHRTWGDLRGVPATSAPVPDRDGPFARRSEGAT